MRKTLLASFIIISLISHNAYGFKLINEMVDDRDMKNLGGEKNGESVSIQGKKTTNLYPRIDITTALNGKSTQITPINLNAYTISAPIKEYLTEVFPLLEQSIVEGIVLKEQILTHGTVINSNYDYILESLEKIDAPTRLKLDHQLLIEAIDKQKIFFKRWGARPHLRFNSQDRFIKASEENIDKVIKSITFSSRKESPENILHILSRFEALKLSNTLEDKE